MYFVAPRSFKRVVQRDFSERFRDNNNELQVIEKSPVIYATFSRDRHLPLEFRKAAVEFFNNPTARASVQHIGGVSPDGVRQGTAPNLPNHISVGNTQGGQTADAKGKTAVFEADNPLGKLGIIDTDDPHHVDPEYKELVEAYLLDPKRGYGRRWISFSSKQAPPWPTYDNLKGEGVVRKITDRIEDDGHSVEYVLNYERDNANRHSVIKALEEIVAAQVA